MIRRPPRSPLFPSPTPFRSIGADIAQREQTEIQKALQLELPAVAGEPIRVLYVQMDGTGVPVVKKETVGRQGKTDRKSTRLNSSHSQISYAVFCLKKKKKST